MHQLFVIYVTFDTRKEPAFLVSLQ